MISIIKKAGEALLHGELSDLAGDSFVIAEVVDATKKDIKDIVKHVPISEEDLNDSLDEDARPRVTSFDDHHLIIFKCIDKQKNGIETTPIVFMVAKKNVVIFRKSGLEAYERMAKLSDEKKLEFIKKGPIHILYRIMDDVFRHFFGVLDTIEETIDTIETEVLKNPTKKTMEKIFRMKKALIYIYKAMTANKEVVSDIEKGYITQLTKEEMMLYRDLYYDATQIMDISTTQRDILTGTLDVYLSSVSNNLNVIIKKMTAVGSFILIPTLITGIYGMNFENLPELYWKYGYFFSLGLMAFSVVVMWLYFKRKGYI